MARPSSLYRCFLAKTAFGNNGNGENWQPSLRQCDTEYYLESSSYEMMKFLPFIAFGVWVEDNFHLGFLNFFFQDFERHLSL